MKNIEITVEGNNLVIKIDLTKSFGRSSSGKSEIIASTEGNVGIEGKPKMFIGLNVYKK